MTTFTTGAFYSFNGGGAWEYDGKDSEGSLEFHHVGDPNNQLRIVISKVEAERRFARIAIVPQDSGEQ